ncbi:MAG: hypothetical protein ACYSR9_15720, partial [Planctomycetota bacterium]
ILTCLVAAASKNYGTYFTTEESGVNRPQGVAMRIFDAATSAAQGAYFKSIIGTGPGLCGGRNLPVGQPTEGAKNLSENFRYISTEHPIIDVAVLFPNTTIAIRPSVLNSLYHQGGRFRAFIDFDLIDENMIGDSMLKNYRFLALLEGGWIRSKTLEKIRDWITAGGILISGSHPYVCLASKRGSKFLMCYSTKKKFIKGSVRDIAFALVRAKINTLAVFLRRS